MNGICHISMRKGLCVFFAAYHYRLMVKCLGGGQKSRFFWVGST